MSKLKEFFDGECCRVIIAGIAGTVAGIPVEKLLSMTCSIATLLYVIVKLYKQIRDWKKRDRD